MSPEPMASGGRRRGRVRRTSVARRPVSPRRDSEVGVAPGGTTERGEVDPVEGQE